MANEKKQLIYLIHGFMGSSKSMQDVAELCQENFPNADVINEDNALRWALSMRRAPSLVLAHISRLDRLTAETDYDEIFLIGHSAGGLIAQRILAEVGGLEKNHKWVNRARSEYDHKLEGVLQGMDLRRDWAAKVTKLVLIASMSKGWSTENTQNGIQGLAWSLGAFVGHILPKFLRPTIFDFRRGSPFIVQTRLRGIDFKPKAGQKLDIVQMIGSEDGLVSPTDSLDMLMPRARNTGESNVRFQLVMVPKSTHSTILNFKYNASLTQAIADNDLGILKGQKARYSKRLGYFKNALLGNFKRLEVASLSREDLMDELPQRIRGKNINIAFIIHGIRDRGFWTKKIGARIKQVAKTAELNYHTRTPTYGYFPILPFLTPWYRLAKVEWMMDQYADVRAAYPDAKIHYVGHSNGTYLCAKGLEEYPAVDFERIMFAGSVVRANFPWRDFIKAGRVKGIFNAPATNDVVVAAFPYGLRYFRRLFDLGGAGHKGFDNPRNDKRIYQLDQRDGRRTDMHYVEGDHKCARKEEHWLAIAKYIVNEEHPNLNDPIYRPRRKPSAVFAGWISAVCFPLLILGVALFSLYTFGAALEETHFGVTNAVSSVGTSFMDSAVKVNRVLDYVPYYEPVSDWIGSEWRDMQAGGRWLFFIFWILFVRFVAIRV